MDPNVPVPAAAPPKTQNVARVAANELAALKCDGVEAECVAGVEVRLRSLVQLMAGFEAARAACPPQSVGLTKDLGQIVTETSQSVSTFMAQLRYLRQAAQIEAELYKMPEAPRPADAVLDLLRQQEVRTLLRQRTAAEVEKIYLEAVASTNVFMMRAIEGDPMQALVPPALIEEGRRRRAEQSNPQQSKQLFDILRAQRAVERVAAAAMLALGTSPPAAPATRAHSGG